MSSLKNYSERRRAAKNRSRDNYEFFDRHHLETRPFPSPETTSSTRLDDDERG